MESDDKCIGDSSTMEANIHGQAIPVHKEAASMDGVVDTMVPQGLYPVAMGTSSREVMELGSRGHTVVESHATSERQHPLHGCRSLNRKGAEVSETTISLNPLKGLNLAAY